MKSTTKLMIGAVALSLVASAGLSAFTYAADNQGEDQRERPQLTEEQRTERKANHEFAKEALENNDYATWAELLADHPKADEFVTEENFNTLVQAHDLMEAGDKEGAKALFEDAGLNRPGKFKHRGDHAKRGENREAFREAVANGDYSAWAELNADRPNADEFVNEETFSALQQAHELAVAGDKEGAREILKDLGIKRPKGRK